MKPKIVHLPTIKEPAHESPGFAKKLLADADALGADGWHVELMGLCGFGCRYCSSNTGNFLRIQRGAFAAETLRQTGERIAPVDIEDPAGAWKADPALTFVWDGVDPKTGEKTSSSVEDALDAQLHRKGPTWGEGRMMVMSQLTDAFSPLTIASGTTERVLRWLIERTRFRIRILTKNAAVAKPPFLQILKDAGRRVLVGLSIGTMDDAWASKIEPGTSPPSARIRAMQTLADAGVPYYVMACPVFPDAVFEKTPGRRLEDLLDAQNPRGAEHVYFEAVNDRGNWRSIADGYAQGSAGRAWLERVWGQGDKAAWSSYATELHVRIMAKARAEGWEARHLLYEDMITAHDAKAFAGFEGVPALDGVLLQSPTTSKDYEGGGTGPARYGTSGAAKDGAGWSRNPHMRALQSSPDHGHAEGWKRARIAAGLGAVCLSPKTTPAQGSLI